MTTEVKTYDPSQVSLIVGGTIVKSWNKIAVAKDEDGWSFNAGTQGRFAHAAKWLPEGDGTGGPAVDIEVAGLYPFLPIGLFPSIEAFQPGCKTIAGLVNQLEGMA